MNTRRILMLSVDVFLAQAVTEATKGDFHVITLDSCPDYQKELMMDPVSPYIDEYREPDKDYPRKPVKPKVKIKVIKPMHMRHTMRSVNRNR